MKEKCIFGAKSKFKTFVSSKIASNQQENANENFIIFHRGGKFFPSI